MTRHVYDLFPVSFFDPVGFMCFDFVLKFLAKCDGECVNEFTDVHGS